MRRVAQLVIVLGALLLATSGVWTDRAAAISTVTPGWIDARTLEEKLETHGAVYEGRRRAIDFASCAGLRRYGSRPFGYTTAYHRFKCSLAGADEHRYTTWINITRSVLAAKPIPGRGEPSYLARDLREAQADLDDAREAFTIIGTPTPAQLKARAEYLRPFEEAVADAKAALEPYRTLFWWRITQIRRDY